MVLVHAVKLTRIDKDGKLNTHKRTYGLLYGYIEESERYKNPNISYRLFHTEKSLKKLGMEYGGYIQDKEKNLLSFRSPVDIVHNNGYGKKLDIWKAENLPENLQKKFYEGMFHELELDKIPLYSP